LLIKSKVLERKEIMRGERELQEKEILERFLRERERDRLSFV